MTGIIFKTHLGNLCQQCPTSHEFYRNKGEKNEVTFFGKLTQKVADKLAAYVDYNSVMCVKANGTVNELGTIAIDDSFNFFNPKLE